MTELPVIFRKHHNGLRGRDSAWDVTAFFPTLPGDSASWYNMTCYAHIGQHGSAHPMFFREGRAAKPDEYADLLAELRGIYENDPEDPITLKVCRRATSAMHDAREAAWRGQRAA